MSNTAPNPGSGIYHNLVIFNGYPISVVVAVAFHSLLLAGLVLFQNDFRDDTLELVQPTVIKALFIDENPQVRNERIIEQQRVQRQEDQRLAREEEQRQQQLEQQRQEAAEQQQREQEAAREQALLLEREALERQQELERQRAEQEQRDRDREQQRELEQQRQRDLAEQQRRQQENERIRQQQAANEAAAVEAARTEFELVQSATALIQQLVQEQWSRPPSARNGMRAVVQISMLPNGDLLGATITQSSGDAAFDRSAENAVYGAAPFRELSDLPTRVFNENFRTLSLTFQPEDLLN